VVRQWIVNNDRTKGLPTKEVAEALDIQAAAAVADESVAQTRAGTSSERGYYRPVE